MAIVGPTGSGKTTIIRLLLRMYPIQKGQILVDGVPIDDYDLAYLRSQMAVVLQDVFLFSGTVMDNIRLRSDIPEEKAIEAARFVSADFVEQYPDGYATEVKERGATLSVGERQLLSYARAVAFEPKILVLDEATASIDSHTENVIQASLKRIMQGRTSIVIAHRLSTIRESDRILVVHQGQHRRGGHARRAARARAASTPRSTTCSSPILGREAPPPATEPVGWIGPRLPVLLASGGGSPWTLRSPISAPPDAGRRSHLSTVRGDRVCNFVSDDERVLYRRTVGGPGSDERTARRSFERAGPRERIYFDPKALRVGDRDLRRPLPGDEQRHPRRGHGALLPLRRAARSTASATGSPVSCPAPAYEPIELDRRSVVDDIHHHGGSILGSSRGPQDVASDGRHARAPGDRPLPRPRRRRDDARRARDLRGDRAPRPADLASIGVPKTIDNDIYLVEKTFGFETAFSIAIEAIRSAHIEAKGYPNGVGLVRLMGRQLGVHRGERGGRRAGRQPRPRAGGPLRPRRREADSSPGSSDRLATTAPRRHRRRRGSRPGPAPRGRREAIESGRVRQRPSPRRRAVPRERRISEHLTTRGVAHSLKYIDPSYMIRSAPANPNDSIFARTWRAHAVHAGMSGTHGHARRPLERPVHPRPARARCSIAATAVDPKGDLWLAVLESTGQPAQWA